MDSYKLTQNPGKSQKPANNKTKPAKRTAKKRSERSLNPQVVLGGIVLVMVLVLGGLVWAHYFGKSNAPATPGSTNSSRAPAVVPAKTFNSVTDAIGNNNISGLSHFYGSRVHVVMPGSGYDKTLGASDVNSIISNPLNGAQTPWNWHVSASDLSAWQTGPYGQYFVGNVIVGISSDGTVISLGLDSNGQITTVFVAPVSDLTTTSSGTTSSSTTSSGTSSTGSSTTTSGSSTNNTGANSD